MPLVNVLLAVRRRIWIIAVTAALLTGIVVGLSLLQPPKYEASVKMLVGQKSTKDDATPVSVFDLQQLTATVTEVVPTRFVTEAVIQRLDLRMSSKDLLDNLEVEQVNATQLIEIRYTGTDPKSTQQVADTVGDVLSERMSEINAAGDTAITASVVERAALPEEPVSPNPLRNGVLALVAGMLLGTMLALLLEYLDDSWRSSEELESLTAKPNLGMLPKAATSGVRFPKGGQRKKTTDADNPPLHESLITVSDPSGIAAEAYRTLRTNLLYSLVDDPPKVIVVSSANPREGKSFVCANMGVVLAQAGKSTLIFDCDLRRPNMHRVFGARNAFGLTDVLAGQRTLQEVLFETPPGPRLVTTGILPPDPANLLGSEHFTELLAEVRREFDYVLLDSPPIRGGSDAVVLARQGDGMLFVVDAQNTRRWVLQRSMRSLETTGVNVLGTVMNNIEPDVDGYYYRYA